MSTAGSLLTDFGRATPTRTHRRTTLLAHRLRRGHPHCANSVQPSPADIHDGRGPGRTVVARASPLPTKAQPRSNSHGPCGSLVRSKECDTPEDPGLQPGPFPVLRRLDSTPASPAASRHRRSGSPPNLLEVHTRPPRSDPLSHVDPYTFQRVLKHARQRRVLDSFDAGHRRSNLTPGAATVGIQDEHHAGQRRRTVLGLRGPFQSRRVRLAAGAGVSAPSVRTAWRLLEDLCVRSLSWKRLSPGMTPHSGVKSGSGPNPSTAPSSRSSLALVPSNLQQPCGRNTFHHRPGQRRVRPDRRPGPCEKKIRADQCGANSYPHHRYLDASLDT